MRRKLAHLLRRVARVMIRQSNKLDPPVVVCNEHAGRIIGRDWAAAIRMTEGSSRY